MDKLQWIKELVLAEQQMEEAGIVDMSAGFDPEADLTAESVQFLLDLKASFVDAAAAFNQLKGSTIGNIKIYGISKTQADFMLFRNGFKLIFSIRQPGVIGILLNHIGSTFIPGGVADDMPVPGREEEVIRAHFGAFGDVSWQYKNQPVKMDYLVRYYLSRFVRESAK